ncbi:MAG: FtsQ-type POTRA domain-containing protein [Bacilli bacterium]
MAKQIKKKRHIRVIPILLVLLFGVIIYFSYMGLLLFKTENIVILGNSLVSDQELIEAGGISNYPSFFGTSSSSIKRKIKANPYIKDVKVSRRFLFTFEIKVTEYKLLYQWQSDNNKVILEDGTELLSSDRIYGIPTVLNYIPDTKRSSFIDGMNNIEDDLRRQISEITYVPNDFDKDRFLLTMDDSNSVYLTLTKFDMINYYNSVLPQLEGRHGILYLDSGNHFQIME